MSSSGDARNLQKILAINLAKIALKEAKDETKKGD